MALFDRDQQKIIVRVVYDGVERAGKTTNLKQLCSFFTTRRRGELYTPEAVDDRTMYFDWLQLDGGLVGGYPLRCQLLTVPGQATLSRRRWHLLRAADVVVFVCESTAEGADRARSMFGMIRDYARLRPGGPVPLVLQANKQDIPSATEPADLASALDAGTDIAVVGARAHEGVGVRETAVLAIRAAANQVQRILLERGLGALDGLAEGAETLYAAMLAAEPPPPAPEPMSPIEPEPTSPIEAESVSPIEPEPEPEPVSVSATVPEPAQAAEPPIAADRAPVAEPAPIAEPAPAPEPRPTVHPDADGPATRRDPPLPHFDVPSGFIWPAATGRDILRRLVASGDVTRREDLVAARGTSDGSASSDAIIYEAGLWCLKTSARRRFTDIDEARAALLHLARRKILLGSLLPDRTVLCLRQAPDGAVWLWTVTPWLATLRAMMRYASEHEDEQGLAAALGWFAKAAVRAMRLASRSGVALDVHPSNFALLRDEVFYLDDDVRDGSRLPAIGHALLRRVVEYERHEAALAAYLDAIERELAAQLEPTDVARLDLEAELRGDSVRSPGVQRAAARLGAFVESWR